MKKIQCEAENTLGARCNELQCSFECLRHDWANFESLGSIRDNRFFILATLRAWGVGLQGAEALLEEMLSFHLESQQQ